MRGRVGITASHVGKRVRVFIQGDGTTINVTDKDGNEVLSTLEGEEGVVLEKKIFNLRATSGISMKNPRNIEWLKEGVAAEKAGDAVKADEMFTKYLNATQVSVGIITGSKLVDQLANGVEIAATVREITTDNGSLLTLDTKTIAVMEPEILETMDFDIDSFLEDEEEETPEPETKPAPKAKKTKA